MNKCRNCKHWQIQNRYLPELKEYPKNQHPEKGWLYAVCSRIRDCLDISVYAGWDGGGVDSVETEANFGCTLFEEKSF